MRYLGGSIIRKRRLELNLTLDDISRELTKRGIEATDSTVGNWELDKTAPGADDLAALADILDLTLSDLFRGNGK